MADTIFSDREKPETQTAQESVKPVERKTEGLKEVKKTAEKMLGKDYAEAVEGQEGVELSEGKVSEVAGETKVSEPSAGVKSYSADQIEVIRAKLLAAMPPQEEMIRQIKKTLYKKEGQLTKRMKKLKKKAHTHAFQLNIVVAQLRKIREYFAMLAHATYEMIKHLWLKIVHGV